MLVVLALIGAVLLLDKYAVGEFGFSQPLVVCPLFGLLFGALDAGLFLGALLQLVFFSNLPIGRSIPPDCQVGAILGITSFVLLRGRAPMENLLTFSFLIALLGSIIGTYSDIMVRKLNNYFHQKFLKDTEHFLGYHYLGLLATFLRGFVFVLLFLALVGILGFAPGYFKIDRSLLMIISIVLGAANGIFIFYKKKYIVFLLTGAVLGCLYQLFAK